MADDAPPTPAAGWYVDADGSQRYWDGSTWTGHHVAAGDSLPAPDARGPDARAGDIVAAFLLPVLGLVWGLLDLKKRPRAAWQMIIASVVAFVIWALILRGRL